MLNYLYLKIFSRRSRGFSPLIAPYIQGRFLTSVNKSKICDLGMMKTAEMAEDIV